MTHTVYVGNMAQSVSESALVELFSQVGEVASVKIIMDSYSRVPKGYGFVEMSSSREMDTAIKQLNGTTFLGQRIKVNQAQQRKKKGPRGRRGRF